MSRSKAAMAASAQAKAAPTQSASDLRAAFPTDDLDNAIIFYAFGDWGEFDKNQPLADAMEFVAKKVRKPDYILALGDNFYPRGVCTGNEAHHFGLWKERFCKGALSGVRWVPAHGNHDMMQPIEAQLKFSEQRHPVNPHRAWQCRGSLDEPPSTCYTFATPLRFSGSTRGKKAAVAVSAPAASLNASPQPVASAAAVAVSSSSASDAKVQPEKTDLAKSETIKALSVAESKSIPSTNIVVADSPKIETQQHSEIAGLVHITAFDTNIVARAQHRINPQIVTDWPKNYTWLQDTLAAQKANKNTLWKLCLGHHPCYCAGKGHNFQSIILRTDTDKTYKHGGVQVPGVGFENLLIQGSVDCYFAGHEHLMSLTQRGGGVYHAVSGCGVEFDIWGGKLEGAEKPKFDWFGPMGKRGFLVGCITADAAQRTTTMTLSFVSVDNPVGQVLYSKSIVKQLPP